MFGIYLKLDFSLISANKLYKLFFASSVTLSHISHIKNEVEVWEEQLALLQAI